MRFLISNVGAIFVVLVFCFSSSVFAKNQHGNAKNGEGSYYEIYKAIDSLRELTKFNTFYELLKVDAASTSEQISKAFRRLSLQNHPDKLKGQGLWNEKQEKLSNLIQFVGSLLRSDIGRKTYNWVINEAPALHRESIYVTRKIRGKRTQVSFIAVIFICLLFSLLLNAIFIYGKWFISLKEVEKAKEALKAYSQKELKSANRRQRGTLADLIATSEIDTSIPSPLNLWIFKPFMSAMRRMSKNNDILSSKKEE